MHDINLKGTVYFEAVARLGTVSQAARELGLSSSAVSQQIKNLESQLGVQLFRREKRRLFLTVEGDRLFETTSHAFAALRNTRTAIGRNTDMRSLKLRVSPSFGIRWLGPRIVDFIESNAEWTIHVDAASAVSDFESEVVDADLRYGSGSWSGLYVEEFMSDFVLPMCSPSYMETLKNRFPDPVAQLAGARLIDSVKSLHRWDIWLAAVNIDLPNLVFPCRFDRSSMSIEMAKRGGGIALESASLFLSELKRGDLVPLCPEFPVLQYDAYWFVCPHRHHKRRIVQKFQTWLKAACVAHEEQTVSYLEKLGCHFQTSDAHDPLGGGTGRYRPPPLKLSPGPRRSLPAAVT